MRTISCLILLCLMSSVVDAQTYPLTRPGRPDFPSVSKTTTRPEITIPAMLKRPGHYSQTDWRHLIDSIWGPGISTSLKLQTFDTYWNTVDQTWGGFPNLIINWDSLKNVYRPLVATGVSRGRFYGILSRLTRELNEWHVYLKDVGVDAGMGLYSDDIVGQYPNWPSFRYQAGVPILNLNALFFRTPFGAGVTALPDSSSLVYSVMPNHPLGLQPGDIILGYDGIPWKRLINVLFDAELPALKGGQNFSSSAASYGHLCTMIAGMNWGLFDTVDVLKYPTNDTLHYPTSLLKSITAPYFIATEQVPVPGVPFPDLQSKKLVSWGVLQGTSIGYIYVWDWLGMPVGNTKVLFGQAVDELMHVRKVRGLILDFRTNFGGWPDYANDGFKYLFNVDPTYNYGSVYRAPGGGHLDFTFHPPRSADFFTPTPEIFQFPIAVLTGPACGSAGDYNAFRLRFHPMARFFGKPTVGAYVAYSTWPLFESNGYNGRVDNGGVYSHYGNEGYMIHKPFPVDEEVWLTRAGVAHSKDDVVERALEWITGLTYTHDVAITPYFGRPGLDSVCVTAILENPSQHTAVLSAIVTDISGTLRDSVLLHNDGTHGDARPGDSIWSCVIRAPLGEDYYSVALRTDDITDGTFRRLPKAALFTTAGPVSCVGDTASGDPSWGLTVMFRLKVANGGSTCTVPGVVGTIRALDTAATILSGSSFAVGDLAPGQMRMGYVIRISFSPWCDGMRDLPFDVAFSTGETFYWRDTIHIRVTDPVGIAQGDEIPAACQLLQNYPNPFNPTTTIEFALPHSGFVTLKVYNVLGEEVAALIAGDHAAGTFKTTWDASGLPSGVYFYRLTAGEYVQTKKAALTR